METPKCKFPTWTGICKKEANKNGYCLEHEKVKCAKCGKQAIIIFLFFCAKK